MILKALVSGWSIGGNIPNVDVYLESSDGTLSASAIIPVPYVYSDTDLTLQAAANGTITSFCTGLGLPAPIIDWLSTTPTDLAAALAAIPSGLSAAPQAAITDCPADATTNYNTITTLLGAVTGAVNTANTKQNQIATQLNTLLTELRTLGLIHS